MTDNARLKRNFRATKPWKEFRQEIRKSRKYDELTGSRLVKQYELHHLDLNEEHYKDLEPNHFSALNPKSHEVLHFCYDQYCKDPDFLPRLERLIKYMAQINKEAPECIQQKSQPGAEESQSSVKKPTRKKN